MTDKYDNSNWVPVEEALQRACPQALARPDPRGNCVGPQCMAWRWRYNPEQARQRREWGSEGLLEGRCGLAG